MPPELVPHKTFQGDRVSMQLLLPELSPLKKVEDITSGWAHNKKVASPSRLQIAQFCCQLSQIFPIAQDFSNVSGYFRRLTWANAANAVQGGPITKTSG